MVGRGRHYMYLLDLDSPRTRKCRWSVRCLVVDSSGVRARFCGWDDDVERFNRSTHRQASTTIDYHP